MKTRSISPIILAVTTLALAVIACQTISRAGEMTVTIPTAAAKPVETRAPASPAPTHTPAAAAPQATPNALQETPTVQPSPTAPPNPTQGAFAPAIIKPEEQANTCTQDVCVVSGTFLLQRPIGPSGRSEVNPARRYGEYTRITGAGDHGVSFLNSTGTPVLAAADGEVVVAGDDRLTAYSRYTGILGNLVVIKHSLPGVAEPVFTLYAHLLKVTVKAGDTVAAGQEIGQVGMSGSVNGSTLHFEVRMGENADSASRNPELWLVPGVDKDGKEFGALAGRILDSRDEPIQVENLVIERLDESGTRAVGTIYLKPYSERRLAGLSPWEESFAIGDLPAGKYQLTFLHNGTHQALIEIQPGKLTLITFRL